MNIRSVTAVDFRSYPLLDVEFPLGATAIVGENGAGKSSIIQAIDFALFAGRGEGARLVRRGVVDMSVAVVVEHAGEVYSIARGQRGAKPWLQFGGLAGGAGEDLTLETVEATSRRIVEVLGLTREAFRCSCVLMQGDAAAWTEADPRDRKRVLADALGLEEWDRLGVLVKRDRQVAELELAQAERDRQDAAGLEAELAELVESAAGLDVADQERELAIAELAEKGARAVLEAALGEDAARAAHAAARMGVESAHVALRRAEAELEAQAELVEQQVNLEPLAPRVEELIATREALREASRVRDVLLGNRRHASGRVDVARRRLKAAQVNLEALSDTCPTCGQELQGGAFDEARAEHERVVAAANAELEAELKGVELLGEPPDEIDPDEYAGVEAGLARAIEARATIAELERRVRSPGELEAEIAAATTSVEEAARRVRESRRPDPDAPLEAEARNDVAIAEAQVAGSRRALEHVRDAHARIAGRRVAAQERLDGLVGADERRADALHRIDLLERLHAAYSRDGVPALIVEQRAVPALETHANLILEQWASPMRVELRTQRATQTGELRETLDIVVHGSGGEGEYRDYSGGEKTRLNVALRIALALLLSSSRGADVRTLIVDEPEYLDPAGNDALAEILRGLAAERFDRVLLASPKADLGDALDQAILVEKTESGESSIVSAEQA